MIGVLTLAPDHGTIFSGVQDARRRSFVGRLANPTDIVIVVVIVISTLGIPGPVTNCVNPLNLYLQSRSRRHWVVVGNDDFGVAGALAAGNAGKGRGHSLRVLFSVQMIRTYNAKTPRLVVLWIVETQLSCFYQSWFDQRSASPVRFKSDFGLRFHVEVTQLGRVGFGLSFSSEDKKGRKRKL